MSHSSRDHRFSCLLLYENYSQSYLMILWVKIDVGISWMILLYHVALIEISHLVTVRDG